MRRHRPQLVENLVNLHLIPQFFLRTLLFSKCPKNWFKPIFLPKRLKLKFFILSRRRDRGSFITATDLYPLTFAPTYQPNATSIFLHKPLHPASSTKMDSVYIKFPVFPFFFFLVCWQHALDEHLSLV